MTGSIGESVKKNRGNVRMKGSEIRRRREALGWTQGDLAEKAGTNQQTVSRAEKSEDVFSRSLDAMIHALEEGETGAGVAKVRSSLTESNEPVLNQHRFSVHSIDFNQFPVFGATEAGGGSVVVSSEPVEYRPIPSHLAQIREAYGIFVQGESMIPRYEPGEIVEVAPYRALKREIDVVLYSKGGEGERRCLVKRLLRWTDTHWIVRQYNPARDFELERAEWPECHIVLGRQSG